MGVSRRRTRSPGEPLKLAYLFAEKRTGRPVASIAYVNSRDVETAKQLLTEISLDEAPAFLDFALEHFSIRLGVARVCEISFAFVFGNPFEKRGDCFPKLLNSARLHFA